MRMAALGFVLTALVFGCARERGDMVGVAQTTAGGFASPTPSSLVTPGGCSTKLPHALEFEGTSATLSPDEKVEVQSWANCLNLSEMNDSTIVLLGPADTRDDSLYMRRAAEVREELVRRGVERSRIVIGGANAAREGGRLGPSNSILLEVSSSTTLRALNE